MEMLSFWPFSNWLKM